MLLESGLTWVDIEDQEPGDDWETVLVAVEFEGEDELYVATGFFNRLDEDDAYWGWGDDYCPTRMREGVVRYWAKWPLAPCREATDVA